MKVSRFSVVSTGTALGPAAVVHKRLSLVPDDDTAYPLYAKLELLRPVPSFLKRAERNVWLA